MHRQLFACVDCDSFYVSCERVFAPGLARAPVVVLSNNDGCVISRSKEAKALGIRMGAPYFRVRALCEARGVKVFSSNYELYGDLSRRVMETLCEFTPEVDIYSIDEAFLRFPHPTPEDLTAPPEEWSATTPELSTPEPTTQELSTLAREMRARVLRWTGVPVSVGVAATKTLAKLGATLAKRSEKAAGVVVLVDPRHVDCALRRTPARDVWNVGPALAAELHRAGIYTAAQLRAADPRAWPRRASVLLGRVILELRGVSCLPLSVCKPARKSVVCSRSFGRAVESRAELAEAVACHVSRAAEKLRRAQLAARVLVVFASTGRHGAGPRYSNSATLLLPAATDFTPELIAHARRGVERIFREGLRFKKAGVMLLELVPKSNVQRALFDAVDRERAARLMSVVDNLNARMGAETLRFAAAGFKRDWRMLRERRSPCYTTHWDELPEV